MPEVSVIIPVYNTSKYIGRCVESLLVQTLEDIELIFVDDCSEDDSIPIARSLTESYTGPGKSFVYLRTDRNVGPGLARNAGIDAALGKFIVFVDSDDSVEPEFCEKLRAAALDASAPLACCDVRKGRSVYHNPSARGKRYFLCHFVTYCYSFIYDRMFVLSNALRFPGTHSAEDSCFLTGALLAARRIGQVHEALYLYDVRKDSVSHRRNRRRAFQRMASFRELWSYASSHGFLREYGFEMVLIMLKKSYGMALKDLIFG